MRRGNGMRLKVENFAKIKEADIEINGITVIGGENNTGKSTIGKILYTLFTVFHNLDDKVMAEKMSSILQYIFRETKSYQFDNLSDIVKSVRKLVQSGATDENIIDVLNNQLNLKLDKNQEKKILEIFNFKIERLEKLVVKTIFNDEFNEQISPVYDESLVSEIGIYIQNEQIELEFNRNSIEIKNRMDLINDGIYIDNPFVIDEISKEEDVFREHIFPEFKYFSREEHEYDHSKTLKKKLKKSLQMKNESLIESELLRERIKTFIDLITDTVKGDFVEKDDEFVFSDSIYGKDFKLANLSTGIKAFAVVLKLLENNDLKDKSLLVLDEPEIHLHPKWQMLYAEILVMLQKEFNLNVVLTTHSPYFINALEVYSKKHEIQDKMKFYLSQIENNSCVFKDVTENTEKIYSLLAEPFETLTLMENEYDC